MPFSVFTPVLQETQEFVWRGIEREDLADIVGLMHVINAEGTNEYTETVDDLQRQYNDVWSNPLRDGRVIRTVQGKLAAFARIFVNPEPQKENVAFMLCEVAPEARRQGLEQECLDWMQERAVERLTKVGETEHVRALPRSIRTHFLQAAQDSIALYRQNGFEHIRSFYNMERNLREPIPDNPLPEGFTFRVYGEDLDAPMRQALNESFLDHWGHQEVSEADWHPFIMDVSDIRRDLTLAVMDGDEVAAICINRVKAKENERLGVRRGWISTLGTRRAWRKRGIASALLAESMRRFKAEGFGTVGLGVDAENLTGALQLYENIGFRVARTGLILEKRVRNRD